MTLKTDQCSICLDSPPYSECPGRQCQRYFGVVLKEFKERIERAEKALEWCQYRHEVLHAAIDAAIKGDA